MRLQHFEWRLQDAKYIVSCGLTHKSDLEKKFRNINEGISHQGTSTLLNKIYTELYVTEGGSGEVNNEHEIRQIEIKSKRQTTQETPINCNDIFKPSTGKDKYIRTVLTRGVAGIGKTVSVQKFILDWVEGKANQDILLMFPLSFREMNLIKEKTLSLLDLLHHFFPKLKQFRLIDLINCADFKVMFIFDGLDECRLPINLVKNTILSDASEPASVDVLLTNLIKGNLLPSALLWITSRPAAANQILLQYINQVTEIRGFSDPQKEEYFRKRISDESLAEQIITHIKSSRSLYIMCHIPVFCWIAATVLERKLSEAESGEIPKTLTQMFIHFLIFQIKHSSQKYEGKCDIDPLLTKERVLALGELAFQHLESGDLIFYEEDLRVCGTDVKDLLVYSGVCTQIFREEFGLHMGKVFSFVHLSVQEFLAALFAFYSFITGKGNVLLNKNGHLDLFLRFLLGLSLESNQNPLRGLLPQTGNISQKNDQIVNYIKKMIRETPSPEKSINLFHCLNELNDHSLVQEVQTYLRKGDDSCLNGVKLSPDQWSALVFVLLNSEEELEEFDLGKYHSSEESFIMVVSSGTLFSLRLWSCYLTEKSCAVLASALMSTCLKELDLSNNELQDSGVKKLSVGLENPESKLKQLKHLRSSIGGCLLCKIQQFYIYISPRLWGCELTGKSCAALASVLSKNNSSLKELDLKNNKLQDSGAKDLFYIKVDISKQYSTILS
uniref:NACHT domain-containing protein n=1 Tax=Astyanax mexicanus TaxID=7994 RepID=A0A3B1IC53_ASTMX